jgi:predicted naringenin-chalcone synthase
MVNTNLSLHSFKSIQPLYHDTQDHLVDWIVNAHAKSMALTETPDRERLKNVLKRFCVSDKLIAARSFETDREKIYELSKTRPSGLGIDERHRFFHTRALNVMKEIYHDQLTPDHLVHVTCTGYLSPSAPQVYFNAHERAPEITHAYHMGCYAALPAVRMAEALSLSRHQKVDIVHTEMCSLHLNPADHTPEQMVVQTLFADGHMKYSVSPKTLGRRLMVQSIKEKMIPDSMNDMTWSPGPVSMQMSLSKEVPEKIRGSLSAFIRELSQNHPGECVFAIHPGGPKIIDLIQTQLELSDEQVAFSRKVLKERGNMSSATLPHVWKEILDSDYEGKVVSLAFGPGLTIFGGLFEAMR